MAKYEARVENSRDDLTGKPGFTDSATARIWALQVMPDATKLMLFNAAGQSKGWYARHDGTGEWRDADMWQKSI